MKRIRTLLALLLASMVMAGVAFAAPATHSFPEITQTELRDAIKTNKVVLLDCNGSKSYAQGHIPGAIDFEANKDKIGKLLPSNKSALIVAYCGGPKCQMYEQGAKVSQAMGYNNVKHFTGGLSEWKKARLPLEKKG